MSPREQTRRAVLAGLGAGAAGLAGCGGSDTPAESPTSEEDRGGQTPTDGVSTATGGATPADLDLREANVVSVEYEATGGDDYRFDVTLYHDDDGEDGYADWWQVETLDGERLGRRELLHAHSTAPFTRSATITVPESADCVVVRGHDQTHGYGGQIRMVTLATGRLRTVQQGSEPRSFDGDGCP